MSLKTALLAAIGAIAGILIPVASASTTVLTHSVQHLADLYGTAASDLAAKLKLDTTGLFGPDKGVRDHHGAGRQRNARQLQDDAQVLGDVALDLAQAAYRASAPSIGADIVALVTALTANPLVKVAAELVAPVIQAAADKVGVEFGLAAPAVGTAA